MRIEIWSDVVCPFCYIGKASLDAALKDTGIDADIVHRAFRLQPGSTPEPVEDMLARKYGLKGEAAQVQQKRVVDMAAQVGLDFHLDGTLIGDTRDAHALLALAADKGVDLLTPLYRAYFTEGRNVFDRDVLLSIGEDSGLTPADMQAALTSTDVAARITADEQTARRNGVQGVPFFVIDGRLAVSGAQPPAVFADALRQAAPELTGPVCGPEGCDAE